MEEGLLDRLRGLAPAVLEPLLLPLGGRFDAGGGGESARKPLSARLRVPLLPLSAPSFLRGSRRGLRPKVEIVSYESPLDSEEPPGAEGREREEDGSRLNASRRAEMGVDEPERTDLDTGLGDDDDSDGLGFLSPREVMSTTSCGSRTGFESCTSNDAELFDAAEDFASDGSLSPLSPFLRMKTESELHCLWLNLAEEIGKREAAEMNLLKMQNQWRRLAESLHQAGLSFPAIPQDEEDLLELDPAQICQEILFKKSVSEAIERDLSGAEAAAAAEAVIKSKNQYISQMQRRLDYHKAVNLEMSLRNHEIALLAHQQRARRRKISRLIWVWVGLSATLGASWFASSYLDYSLEDLLALFNNDRHAESEKLHHGAE